MEIERLKDAVYMCYEQEFNEALTQVKHFASGTPIDLSNIDQERKLAEILAKEVPTNGDVQEMVTGLIIQLGEEKGGNPCLLS